MRGQKNCTALHVLSGSPAVCRDPACDLLIARIIRIGQSNIHIGIHVTGCNTVHVDILARQFIRHRLTELSNTTLGCSVGGNSHTTKEREHRGDIDNLAVWFFLFKKLFCRQLAQYERGRHIDFDHLIPILGRKLFAGIAALDTGSIDDDVQASKQLNPFEKSRFPLLCIRKIYNKTLTVIAAGAKLPCHILRVLSRSKNNDSCPSFKQTFRHAVSESTCSTGNDRAPPLNIEQIHHITMIPFCCDRKL